MTDTREIVAGAPSAEAINLRSMASWERKQGRVELADVLASTADTIERLTSQLAEARTKAIEECIAIADTELQDPKASGRSIARLLRALTDKGEA